jgi:hypothetical protein
MLKKRRGFYADIAGTALSPVISRMDSAIAWATSI